MLGGVNARERLVDATQELLWEQGYAATSPKDILHRAGAGQGSMYHHFAGKQLWSGSLHIWNVSVIRYVDAAWVV